MSTMPYASWLRQASTRQAADDARHHFSRFLDENIARFRGALIAQSNFASMPTLKGIDREHAHWATERVFNSCRNMDRMDRGFAAVTRLSGGNLPAKLSPLHAQLLRTREKLKHIRQKFYPPACYVEQRLRTNLAEVIGPLCDDLEGLVIAYYTVAKSLYDLPELDDLGAKQ